MKDPHRNRSAPIRIGLLHTLLYAAMGISGPFVVIYYKRVLVQADGTPAIGLIGLIIFLGTIVGVLSLPVAGVLVDRFKIENRLLTVLASLVALGTIPVALAGIRLDVWPLGIRWLVLAAGVMVIGLFVRPIFPIVDTETLSYLHLRDGSGERYGHFRAFGTIGWVLAASTAGLLIGKNGPLVWAFFGSALGYLVLAAVAATGFRPEIRPVKIPWAYLRGDGVFGRYLLFTFIFYLAGASSFNFTGYLLDDLHVGPAGIGLVFGLGAIWEIPIMRRSDRLLSRLGPRRMIMFGASVTTFKLILFVLAGGKGRPILMAMLHSLTGIGYPLVFLGSISFMDRRAHRDLRATYQTLNQVVATVAMATAGPFGSFVVGQFGGRWLMGLDAALLAVAIGYFAIAIPEGPLTGTSPVPVAAS